MRKHLPSLGLLAGVGLSLVVFLQPTSVFSSMAPQSAYPPPETATLPPKPPPPTLDGTPISSTTLVPSPTVTPSTSSTAGKLEPALYERLQTMQATDTVAVGIWVAAL